MTTTKEIVCLSFPPLIKPRYYNSSDITPIENFVVGIRNVLNATADSSNERKTLWFDVSKLIFFFFLSFLN